MKKMKKFTAGLLAALLVLGTVNSPKAVAEEIGNSMNADNGLGLGDISQGTDISYLQDTVISPAFIKTSDQAAEYTQTVIDIPTGSEDTILTYPVMVPERGAVMFFVKENDEVEFSSLTMELYSDVACTEKYGNAYYFGGDAYGQKQIFCPKAGTYYLKVVLDRKYNVMDAKSFTLYSSFISNADRTLEENTLVCSYADYDNKDIMYKVKVKKTGVIAFAALPTDGTSLMTGYATLYNAKKKAVSSQEYISNSQDNTSDSTKYARAYYTVKKGTYYIKFSSSNSYFAGYVLEKVKDTSGASKAKATKLVIGGKAKEGTVLVSDSTKKTDWYKITLKKKTGFTIVVDSYVSGKLKMEVCNSQGRTVLFGSNSLYTAQNKLRTKGKWSKGTYYIKISKDSQKSSGYYKLKVKK